MLEPALVPVVPEPEEVPPVVPLLEALVPVELEPAAIEPAALEARPALAVSWVEMDPWQPLPARTSTTQSVRVERMFPPRW